MFEDIMPFFPHIDSVSPKLTPYLGTDTHLLGLFRFTFPTPAKLPYKSGLRLTCII